MGYSKLLKITGPRSFTMVMLARLAVQDIKEQQQSSSTSKALFHEGHAMKVWGI